MNENVLKALMRLFALVADVNKEGFTGNERGIVMEYLQRQFSSDHINNYIRYYDEYLQRYHPELMYQNEDEAQKQNSINYNIILEICRQINEELEQAQKVIVIVHLLDFINSDAILTPTEVNFVNGVGRELKIDKKDFDDLRLFTFGMTEQIKNKSNLLYIDTKEDAGHPEIKHLKNEGLDGVIKVIHVPSVNLLIFRYTGNSELFLNGLNIKTNRSYVWSVGSVIKSSKVGSFYYTHVAGKFIQSRVQAKFTYTARDIEFKYANSTKGVERFNFTEESGRLIGIIGGSGSGKSTLLKVLNGSLTLKNGTIKINDFDIHENKKEIKGLIGYVPQEDLLIKELTVYENLYYNAKLCLADYDDEKIHKLVEEALLNFDLEEARDLQVGDEINTILSGGQRKRLNIALELIREPAILFVDEPTSGLSSADSEKVISMLKRQTFRGRMVITTIHQPSSDIYKLIDKILIVDQGGRVIYYGNPLDAISYFKKISQFPDAEQSECPTCGNINADQILKIVEARVVDVNGRLTRKRKTSPQEWYDIYIKDVDKPIISRIKRSFTSFLPESKFKIPPKFKQFSIFTKRDILSKISNKQYLLLTVLEAPLLALILAFFTKQYVGGTDEVKHYVFNENVNIPAYLFMSVIVALFMGLVLSAEEIFKDRRILKREKFLNLSRSSYLTSKIVILFFISAIQTLIFVLIGNYILDFKGMNFYFWVILFSTACWANLAGLNISAGLNSIVTIYILIPMILVPQLLFSGVVVEYNKMHRSINSNKYVPIIGDVMVSRWAFEAMMVTQYRDNRFEKNFWETERQIDKNHFYKAYYIPYLNELIDRIEVNLEEKTNLTKTFQDIDILNNALGDLYEIVQNKPDYLKENITIDSFNASVASQLKSFLDYADEIFHKRYLLALKKKEKLYENQIVKYGGKEKFTQAILENSNERVRMLVTNQLEDEQMVIEKGKIIRTKSAIYRYPESKWGRAHFFAPAKRIGNFYIDTFYFNIIFIWLITGLLFVMLYFDLVRKVIEYFEHLRLNRFNKKILSVVMQYEARK